MDNIVATIIDDPLRTGLAGLKVLVIEANFPVLLSDVKEEISKNSGFDVAYLYTNHTPSDFEARNQLGFLFGPLWVTWIKKANLWDQELQSRYTGRKLKRKTETYERKLRASSNLDVGIIDLTPDRFNEWYELYEEWVISRELGHAMISRRPEDLPTEGRFWKIVTIRSKVGNLVAGSILECSTDFSTCKIKGAASSRDPSVSSMQLGFRLGHTASEFAARTGFKNMSYGSDPNIYGELASVGLHNFKAMAGYQPMFASGPHSKTRFLFDPSSVLQPWISYVFSDGDPRSPLHLVTSCPHSDIVSSAAIQKVPFENYRNT